MRDDNMDRISTRSWLYGKPPILVSVVKIRPTNLIGKFVLETEYSPILLVRADDKYFYIVDGNHRFFKRVFSGDRYLRPGFWKGMTDEGFVVMEPSSSICERMERRIDYPKRIDEYGKRGIQE